MFITTPGKVLALDASPHDKVEGTHMVLLMQRNAARALLDNVGLRPTEAEYKAAADHLRWAIGVSLSVAEVTALLEVYPRARLKLSEWGIGDTEVREELSSAFAHLLTGSQWPTYGDDVDVDAFVALLRRQAAAIGFGAASEGTSP
jgi:hypothetical protein